MVLRNHRFGSIAHDELNIQQFISFKSLGCFWIYTFGRAFPRKPRLYLKSTPPTVNAFPLRKIRSNFMTTELRTNDPDLGRSSLCLNKWPSNTILSGLKQCQYILAISPWTIVTLISSGSIVGVSLPVGKSSDEEIKGSKSPAWDTRWIHVIRRMSLKGVSLLCSSWSVTPLTTIVRKGESWVKYSLVLIVWRYTSKRPCINLVPRISKNKDIHRRYLKGGIVDGSSR